MCDSVETYVQLPCLSYHRQYTFVCHTDFMTSPSVYPSKCQSSDHHTVDGYSLSACQAYIPPVRHTIMMTSLSVRLLYAMSDHHTDLTTSPSVCQSRQSSVRRTVELTRLSVCQRKYMPVCHTINMTSPSICQPHDTSVCHAMKTHSPSPSHIRLSYQHYEKSVSMSVKAIV